MLARANVTQKAEHNTPPNSVEAEMGLLGSILQSPHEVIAECVEKRLDSQHFYVPAHRTIYTVLCDMHDAGEAIDFITLTQFLRDRNLLDSVGGPAVVTNLFTFVPTAANVQYYLEIVRDKYVLREARRAAEIAIQQTNDAQGEPWKVLDVLESRIDSLRSINGRNGSDARKALIEFRSPLQLKNFTPPTGIVLVGDCHIVKGSVFVIGGAPGVGKSRASVSLAVAGATCSDWFSLKVHRKLRVMIIQSENGEFRLSKEFAELNCNALEDYVRICPPPPFGICFQREDFRVQLAAAIAEFKPDIVIFDPWNAAARDEKAREYLETFDDLRSVLPLGDDAPALGIVAHTRKPKMDERASGRALLNLLAGSYVLGSVPRTVFVMQAASDETTDNRVVWTCCKNNDGELGARSAWERRNGLFAPVPNFDWEAFDAPEPDKREKITDAHMRKVFENGALTTSEARKLLEDSTGASRSACYYALDPDGRFSKHLNYSEGKLAWK
jgi:hypothetical protein